VSIYGNVVDKHLLQKAGLSNFIGNSDTHKEFEFEDDFITMVVHLNLYNEREML
jgi:hypothetical protein